MRLNPLLAVAAVILASGCGPSGGEVDNGPADVGTDVDPCGGRCKPDQTCFQGFCCDPFCQGRQCGDDGCGGSCGNCPDGQDCFQGVCCTPNCADKECGDNGCGGVCGTCDDDLPCNAGKCCVPVCGDAVCGEDSCGRSDGCGTCGAGFRCQDGQCCKQACSGLDCGDDGCGGTCGECSGDEFCEVGHCRPEGCEGRWCGQGTGGIACGDCDDGEVCFGGVCCTPDCSGKICGDDGCGGPCGQGCTGDDVCCFNGTACCPAFCAGRECGADGAGGFCGPSCPGELVGTSVCTAAGLCCNPDCGPGNMYQCGDDGCGGKCGECGPGVDCRNHFCPITTGTCLNGFCEKCNPEIDDCSGTVDEGCATCPGDCGICVWPMEFCGACEWPEECIDNKCCDPDCGDRMCGPDPNGCGSSCGSCGHGYTCDADGFCQSCDDLCTPGRYCNDALTGTWECVYATEGCNTKTADSPCANGCSQYINDCMEACPATHGKCSAPGAYKCFPDAPQCLFMCPTDESIPAASRYWSILANCSASGDTCVCGEMDTISACMVNDDSGHPCYGERVP